MFDGGTHLVGTFMVVIAAARPASGQISDYVLQRADGRIGRCFVTGLPLSGLRGDLSRSRQLFGYPTVCDSST